MAIDGIMQKNSFHVSIDYAGRFGFRCKVDDQSAAAFRHSLLVQAVKSLSTLPAYFDQTSFSQQPQMVRYRRLANTNFFDQLADAAPATATALHYFLPGFIRQ